MIFALIFPLMRPASVEVATHLVLRRVSGVADKYYNWEAETTTVVAEDVQKPPLLCSLKKPWTDLVESVFAHYEKTSKVYFKSGALLNQTTDDQHSLRDSQMLRHCLGEILCQLRRNCWNYAELDGNVTVDKQCWSREEIMRTGLLRSVPFLVSLLEWPFLDILVKMFDLLKRCDFCDLIGDENFDTTEQLLKALVEADGDQGIGWHKPLSWITDKILGSLDIDGERCVPFATLLLEDLNEQQKVHLCRIESGDVLTIFCRGCVERLDWMYNVCRADDRATMVKDRLLDSNFVNIWCRYVIGTREFDGAALVLPRNPPSRHQTLINMQENVIH